MSGSFFDSNVIIYTLENDDREKQGIAVDLLERCASDRTATISFQVVQEVLHAVTRKFSPAFDLEQSRRLLDRALLPLWRISPSRSLYELALDLQQRYHYSFYDSMILAAAISSGCDRLYTDIPRTFKTASALAT